MYKLVNGMWLFQMMPELFLNRFDAFSWVFMKTGIHQWLIENRQGPVLFDIIFYSFPLVYFVTHNLFRKNAVVIALLMLIVNWTYVQCYTLYPTNSIEAHTAWLIFPVVFLTADPKTSRLLMDGLRYFFLFTLVSAGVWKIINGAVFNSSQMSGVLLYQHADLLSTSPGYWQTEMIRWLIDHQWIGFALYLGAALLELVFAIGFFTKKYDHLLIIGFIIFLVFDHLIMRIPYYEWMPYLVTLRIRAIHRGLPAYGVRPQNRIQRSAS